MKFYHVCAPEKTFWRDVFDALDGKQTNCVLRKQTRRRAVMPGPPRPPAPLSAARPDPPVVCPGF